MNGAAFLAELHDKRQANRMTGVPVTGFDVLSASSAADTLQVYVGMLRRHDWSFEFSDDARVVRQGRASLQQLRDLQPVLDADGEVWNAFAPVGHRIGGAA